MKRLDRHSKRRDGGGGSFSHWVAGWLKIGRQSGLVCLFLVLGCDHESRPAFKGPVKVGVILPLEHREVGIWAREVRHGLEMARNNQSNVQFVYRDNGADPVKSAELVHQLVNDERVSLIIGCFTSTCCLAAAERAEALQVPLITPTGTSEEITQDRHWAFRMCFSNAQQGQTMGNHARALGQQRVAILRDITSDYSTGLASSFAETFVKEGGEIVDQFSYRGGRFEKDEIAAWLAQTSCDALFLPIYFRDAALVMNATSSVWSDRAITFLGGDAWEGDDPDQVISWPADVYITSHFAEAWEEEEVHAFLESYQASGRSRGRPSSSAALGYDTGVLVMKALSSGGRQRGDILRALRETMKSFQGVTGVLSAESPQGKTRKQVHLKKWNGSSWSLYP